MAKGSFVVALSLITVAGLGLATAPAARADYTGTPSNAASVPANYSACATDGNTCKVAAGTNVTVYYGAGTKYVVRSGTGDFTCLPATFKVEDPAPNVVKTCWVNTALPAGAISAKSGNATAAPAGIKACGTDGQTCAMTGAWAGYYGANTTFVPISGSGAFKCLPASFNIGDPLPNVLKSCYVGPPPGKITLTRAGGVGTGDLLKADIQAKCASSCASADACKQSISCDNPNVPKPSPYGPQIQQNVTFTCEATCAQPKVGETLTLSKKSFGFDPVAPVRTEMQTKCASECSTGDDCKASINCRVTSSGFMGQVDVTCEALCSKRK